MMWICFYLVAGVFWWLGVAPLKEHAEAWRTMILPVRMVYVVVQIVFGMILWPLGVVGWAITKGFLGGRAKTNFEKSTEEMVRGLDEKDEKDAKDAKDEKDGKES
jgi:hypothetical protein